MGLWGEKKGQILGNRERIKELMRSHVSVREIHRRLTESGEIDISLRQFNRYAAEIRNEVLEELEGKLRAASRDLTAPISNPKQPPAWWVRKSLAAQKARETRSAQSPASSTFDIPDAFSQEYGDVADNEG